MSELSEENVDKFMMELERVVEWIEFDDATRLDIRKDVKSLCGVLKKYGLCGGGGKDETA